MIFRILSIFLGFSAFCSGGGVFVDEPALGGSLGGWKKKGGKAAEYTLSGADYRTYRPEITPTPDGGIFVSIRIDHVRGWLSSDDHAMLEITVDKNKEIVSAQSSIAIQGRSITSDVIRGGTVAGNEVVGVDRALEIGTSLVADVSEKLLREKIVEAGRVSFPSVLRHNYNLLYQALREKAVPAVAEKPEEVPPVDPEQAQDSKEKSLPPKAKRLEIKAYGVADKPDLGPEP